MEVTATNMEGKKIFRSTKSVCPECLKQIDANIVLDELEGKDAVLMRKQCDEHGFYEDIISRNPAEYEKNQKYYHDYLTINNKDNIKDTGQGCPHNCGMCAEHKSTPCIALVDVTNRCNLACPICFANASAKGYIVEPTMEELRKIFQHFCDIRPVPPVLLQLSGGEPTVREDLPEIIAMGKKMGFSEIMLTTNGLKLAARNGPAYIKQLKEAGMNAVYLSFDSADDPEAYRKIRGVNLLEQKKRVIENCRKAGFFGVSLVPVIAKGLNEHQVGPIMKYAMENKDVVVGVIFQPVSLCGRIDNEQIRELRYTTSDLAVELSKVTGIKNSYIYPIPAISSMTKLMGWYDFAPRFTMAAHPDCGFATLMVPDNKGVWHPIEDWFDADGLIAWVDKVWGMIEKREWPDMSEKFIGPLAKMFGEKIGNVLNQASDFAYRKAMKAYFIAGAMRYLKGIDGPIQQFLPLILNPKLETASSFFEAGRSMLVSSMHFQDVYNFDIERVQRCLVHYGVMDPDDPAHEKVLQIPFCAMNSIHRETIEKKLATQQVKIDPKAVLEKAKDFIEKEVINA
ncbi:MAG TPA: radical SAM protein [Candidatus Lokiarchaeia archaeon]|nr:radical SAM protein [Candidatus Lokiarchaeia archaeon]